MSFEIAIVFVLLVASFFAMASEKAAPDVVALGAMAALLGLGILSPTEAFEVFSNDAAIAVASMFIISAGLERTGALDGLGNRLNAYVGQSDGSVLIVLLPVVACVSAFVNNTPVVLILLPIVTSLATKRGIKPSRLLIPLSFASILGGCCTLIGTSTNLVIGSTAKEIGGDGLAMFDLAKVGSIIGATGIFYLLTMGRHLLPNRETLTSILQSTDSNQYRIEVAILKDSPLIGKRVVDSPIKNLPHCRVLQVMRHHETLPLGLDEITLQSGDRLCLSVVISSVVEIKNLPGIEILEQSEDIGLTLVDAEKTVVVEGILNPQSRFEGYTVRDADLRRRYGIRVLALHRRGVNLRNQFEDTRLRVGDTLLFEGTPSSIARLQESRNFLVFTQNPQPIPRRNKQPFAVIAVFAIILLASLTTIPISALAMMAALFVVLSGCLENDEAYRAIDWRLLFMIFGMLSLGLALKKTGGIALIAKGLLDLSGSLGAKGVLSAIILACSFLTTFLPNNAVAVMVTPVACQVATSLDVESKPFLIGTAIGCSACFATPIGYQTNTLVYGAGGYRFIDFIKVGIPLNLLVWILASLLIPFLYPFSK